MPEHDLHHDLLARCRKSDRLAQEQVYRLYYKAMYNVSFRLLGDQMEAEDVMQEAFLSAFRNINSWRGEVTFGAWLKKIVVNKSIDALRTRKIKFEEINEKLENETTEPDIDFDDADSKHAVEKIRTAMLELPDGFRAVLSLFLFEGYDHSEIAHIFNISESTSRSQLVRARKKLAEILKKRRYETR